MQISGHNRGKSSWRGQDNHPANERILPLWVIMLLEVNEGIPPNEWILKSVELHWLSILVGQLLKHHQMVTRLLLGQIATHVKPPLHPTQPRHNDSRNRQLWNLLMSRTSCGSSNRRWQLELRIQDRVHEETITIQRSNQLKKITIVSNSLHQLIGMTPLSRPTMHHLDRTPTNHQANLNSPSNINETILIKKKNPPISNPQSQPSKVGYNEIIPTKPPSLNTYLHQGLLPKEQNNQTIIKKNLHNILLKNHLFRVIKKETQIQIIITITLQHHKIPGGSHR